MPRNRHRTMRGIEYMIVDKKKTHRVKIEPATADHMVGVSLSALHKPEIYLLLGIFIQRLKEVKI